LEQVGDKTLCFLCVTIFIMSLPVFVFDPTVKDSLSKARGIGRYLKILKENFEGEFKFVNNLNLILRDSVFINPFFNFLQPPIVMKKIAKKQIAVIHDLIPLKYPLHFPVGIKGNLNIYLNKLSLKNYDLIITDSEASKKDIVRMLNIDEKKVRVIYPALPKVFLAAKSKLQNYNSKTINFKQKKLEIDDSKLFGNSDLGFNASSYYLYVGDATWNKNLINLAKAIKIANVTCVFVGKVFSKNPFISSSQNANLIRGRVRPPGKNALTNFVRLLDWRKGALKNRSINPWLQELHGFFEEIQGDKRFLMVGFVSDEDLIKLYQNACGNILVSRDEGFGFSFLEAASQSCPSILADIAVLREIAGAGALFADPNDPDDIADKIGSIYFNRDLRNKIGNQAEKQSASFSKIKFRKSFLEAVSG